MNGDSKFEVCYDKFLYAPFSILEFSHSRSTEATMYEMVSMTVDLGKNRIRSGFGSGVESRLT